MAYKFSQRKIKVPNHDHDITIAVPGGGVMTLQYRVEGNSIDLCLPPKTPTMVWKDGDLTPAHLKRNGSTFAEQICLMFAPSASEKPGCMTVLKTA